MIQDNLFDLTAEQEAISKKMFNGQIIKCLVAPYHTYGKLGDKIKYNRHLYLFPERDASYAETRQFIFNLSKLSKKEEILIITSSQNILLDLPSDVIRILTEQERVVDCQIPTLCANIHNIRYDILENGYHHDEVKPFGIDYINILITEINEAVEQKISNEEVLNDLLSRLNLVGEEIIRTKLKQTLQPLMSKQQKIKDLEARIAELESLKNK